VWGGFGGGFGCQEPERHQRIGLALVLEQEMDEGHLAVDWDPEDEVGVTASPQGVDGASERMGLRIDLSGESYLPHGALVTDTQYPTSGARMVWTKQPTAMFPFGVGICLTRAEFSERPRSKERAALG